jgi:hypothetical protein
MINPAAAHVADAAQRELDVSVILGCFINLEKTLFFMHHI